MKSKEEERRRKRGKGRRKKEKRKKGRSSVTQGSLEIDTQHREQHRSNSVYIPSILSSP